MVLSATGYRAARKNDKSPVRVAAGKRAVQSPKHTANSGRLHRSNHLGYDCYSTGAINGSQRIRCAIRPSRIRPTSRPTFRRSCPSSCGGPNATTTKPTP